MAGKPLRRYGFGLGRREGLEWRRKFAEVALQARQRCLTPSRMSGRVGKMMPITKREISRRCRSMGFRLGTEIIANYFGGTAPCTPSAQTCVFMARAMEADEFEFCAAAGRLHPLIESLVTRSPGTRAVLRELLTARLSGREYADVVALIRSMVARR